MSYFGKKIINFITKQFYEKKIKKQKHKKQIKSLQNQIIYEHYLMLAFLNFF
jgi:hypothetical protein